MRIGLLSWFFFVGKGGAERFCARLSSAMLQRGHECVIFHQTAAGQSPAYPLPAGVPTFDLALHDAASLQPARRLVQLAGIDMLCVFNSGQNGLWIPALLHNSGIPLLASERCAPLGAENYYWNRSERLACLAAADAIHLLSHNYLSSLPVFLQKRAMIIPNPAMPPVSSGQDGDASGRKRLLAVARLEEPPKQLSFLIRAFAILAEDFPDWDCIICGEGRSRDAYSALIKDLHLCRRIQLFGVVDDVDAQYRASHIFCLPSAFEGSPNALLEAQSYGLPSVGFAECPGVNEIIVHGENGLLAREMTPESLAHALRSVMKNAELRRHMGEKAREMLSRYEEETIFDQWEILLRQTAAHAGATRLDTLQLPGDNETEQKLHEILARPCPIRRKIERTGHMNQALEQIRLRHGLKVSRDGL